MFLLKEPPLNASNPELVNSFAYGVTAITSDRKKHAINKRCIFIEIGTAVRFEFEDP